jgi:hypothetical protein
MASTSDAHRQRWTMVHDESDVGVFVEGNAIPDYFAAHPEIGSPVGAETDWDGAPGGRIQSFTGAIVVWDPAGGTRTL